MSLNTNGWDYIYTLNVNKLNYPIVSGSNSDAIIGTSSEGASPLDPYRREETEIK